MSVRTAALFVICAALWGASYLFIKVALDDDVSEGVILFFRTLLGGAVLLPVAVRADALRPVLQRKGWLLLLAATQVIVPFALIVVGENWIDSGLTGVLISTAPIFLALMAPWVDPEERSSGVALAGIAIGMTGVVVLLVGDLGDVGGKAILGAALVLAASAIYAYAPLVFKRRFAGVAPVGALTAVMLLSAAVYLPVALASLPDHDLEPSTWVSLIILGAGGTGASFYCFYELINEIGPARASVVAYVAPLFAVMYGVTLLDEAFTVWTFSGMALILGGSWLAARRRA